MLPTDPPPAALRGHLERQLQAVVGMLADGDLDALLDLAITRFVEPTPTLCDDVAVQQVEASLGVLTPRARAVAAPLWHLHVERQRERARRRRGWHKGVAVPASRCGKSTAAYLERP